MPEDGEPIKINGAFHVSTNVIHFIVASAAEAELSALFHNCQMGLSSAALSKTWDMYNPRRLSITTMQLLSALQITQSRGNVRGRWKCASSGLVTNVHRKCTHYTGIQDKRILLITKANIMRAPIILKFALGICMKLILRRNYRGPFSPVL